MKNERFNELLNELKELSDKKNSDYAEESDSLSNFKLASKIGVTPFKGCLIRLSDKFSRICQLAKKGTAEVKEETIVDTLKDLAAYSLIAICLYEEEMRIPK